MGTADHSASAEKLRRRTVAGLKPLLVPLAGVIAAAALSAVLRDLGLGEAAQYVPLAVFLAAVIGAPLIHLRRQRAGGRPADGHSPAFGLQSWSGVMIGMTASLTGSMNAYWFSASFGAASEWIAVTMGMSYIGAACLSLFLAVREGRRAALSAVVALQLASSIIMLLMPWAPSFPLAAAMSIVCVSCSVGTRGGRTAMTMEARKQANLPLASRIGQMLVRLLAVLWPGVFGRLMEEGHYMAPYAIAASMQAGATGLFALAHREKNPQADGSSAAPPTTSASSSSSRAPLAPSPSTSESPSPSQSRHRSGDPPISSG